jgi:hypothetical protein
MADSMNTSNYIHVLYDRNDASAGLSKVHANTQSTITIEGLACSIHNRVCLILYYDTTRTDLISLESLTNKTQFASWEEGQLK